MQVILTVLAVLWAIPVGILGVAAVPALFSKRYRELAYEQLFDDLAGLPIRHP